MAKPYADAQLPSIQERLGRKEMEYRVRGWFWSTWGCLLAGILGFHCLLLG